ncbi:Cullin [Dunaliella salina]|uniref:Cullin n=1 Tax=Dunaliella salina TaxID=3046 RepID=A0ABQ7GUR1_DUNSA|nr:Cullin [Dunaliella salina]|eukprot:KAF5838342.1 Cullin [Dunaliella salina]
MMKRGGIRIEPFRHPVSMDPNYPDKTWQKLETAIREIHNKNASGLSFEELYRNAYNMVLHKHGERLYNGLINTLTAHLQEIARQIEQKEGVSFLAELKKHWDDHNKSTQMIRDILMYMDRTFVAQQQRTPVFALGLELWRNHVVRSKQIAERLRTVLLDLVHRERSGETIDRALFRSITQMLVDLGPAVYMDEFETPFLLASASFYKRLNKYEDLDRMYLLFRRVDGGLATVRTMMADFVKENGRQLVLDPERSKDPVEFVQALLDERDKYETIVSQSFHEDKTFRNALNQSFEYFVNLNQRSPEYISLFIDDRLRKGQKGMNDTEMEVVLDKVMALFRYLQEKDVFEKYYKQHLAKRLLAGRCVSDDAERNLLVKLKTECGYQFTSKLESMFTDIKTSRDTMQDFRSKLAEKNIDLGLELGVQVLTTGSWPTQTSSACILPRELETCCQEFNNYYLGHHSGRKLTWQTNMGTAELKAEFGSKKHELSVSTQQMCILLLFNSADRLSYNEIAASTQIPTNDLKRALQSLACVKGKNPLRKEPMGRDVAETDEFVFNDKFTSKLYKVKISTVAAGKEGETEKAETRHKVLDHNTIITEVTRQLAGRFLPNPALIKKRIESLIEREFLERDSEDRRLYRYLA